MPAVANYDAPEEAFNALKISQEPRNEPETPAYERGFRTNPECPTPVACEMSGKIPDYVKGVLYRNGPGIFKIPRIDDPSDYVHVNHWFDGLAQIHRFEVQEDGNVMYCSKDTAMNCYEYAAEYGDFEFALDQPETKSLYESFVGAFAKPKMANANVNIMEIPIRTSIVDPSDDKLTQQRNEHTTTKTLVATTDGNVLQQVDPVTLEGKRVFDYTTINPAITGLLSSAHANYDPETGEYYNFTLDGGMMGAHFNVFSLSKDQPQGEIVAKVNVAKASYMHSFSITPRFLVLVAMPYYIGANMLWIRRFLDGLTWEPSKPTHFYVIDRKLKKHVATFTSESFWYVHIINSYEDGDDVVIDLFSYDGDKNLRSMTVENIVKGDLQLAGSDVLRCRLKNVDAEIRATDAAGGVAKHTGKAELQVLIPGCNGEMPRINPEYSLKPYRFAYSPTQASGKVVYGGLAKYDMHLGKVVARWHDAGCFASEPVFVRNPKGTAEDDGVILFVSLDGRGEGHSFLGILDAKTMKEVARAKLPGNRIMPFGFHGNFMDD